MKTKFTFYLLSIFLIFTRSYLESWLVQIGLGNNEDSDLVFCGGLGCLLSFKYRIILDILSFVIIYIITKRIVSYNNKITLMVSMIFVCLVMLTHFYWFLGSQIEFLIPEFLYPDINKYTALYFSIRGFVGLIISIVLFTWIIYLIKKRKTLHNNV